MITIEAVRAAVLSERPWDMLDELVRAEMAAGRRVKDIAAAFAAMSDDVWGTPDLTEDGQDAFGDTYDALIGNCLREQWYVDPPNTTLPTEEEIAQLPRWARVAFAAREVRRMMPLFTKVWQHPSEQAYQSVVQAITLGELAASGRLFDSNRVVRSVREADAIGNSAILGELHIDNAVLVESIARGAARVANAALDSNSILPALSSVNDGWHFVAQEQKELRMRSRRDFDHLLRHAEARHWDDDTPVPPDVFGPLWPEGAPAGWPADPDVPARDEFVATALIKGEPHISIVKAEALNVFNAINRYYIARTGQRLTLEGDMPYRLAALVPEGSET